MDFFAVYREDTGELVSTGSVVADKLPRGIAVTKVWTTPDDDRDWHLPASLIWDRNAHAMVHVPTLSTDFFTIYTNPQPDQDSGITPPGQATVIYTDYSSTPAANVTFDVNGLTQQVDTVDGQAQVSVTSRTPGDQITVSVAGLSLVVEVV